MGVVESAGVGRPIMGEGVGVGLEAQADPQVLAVVEETSTEAIVVRIHKIHEIENEQP
jgi:hypothetical protein